MAQYVASRIGKMMVTCCDDAIRRRDHMVIFSGYNSGHALVTFFVMRQNS